MRLKFLMKTKKLSIDDDIKTGEKENEPLLPWLVTLTKKPWLQFHLHLNWDVDGGGDNDERYSGKLANVLAK